MKKVMLIGAAVATLGLSSCKKDWTCTCTDGQGNQLSQTTIEDAKKDEAEDACNYSGSAGGTSIECEVEEK